MVNNINRLFSFCKVAELGSFTKAAEFLNQPKSRVSRAISQLENSLNAQLITRTTRRVSLTDAGEQLYLRTSPLLTDLNNELNRIEVNSDSVSGSLNISAPEDIGMKLLPDIILKYKALYPQVGVQLHLSNEYIDFTKHNFDLAFRIGKLKDSSMIQKKIGDIRLICVASKNYIDRYGEPQSIEDLNRHRFIYFLSNGKALSFGLNKTVPDNAFVCSSFPVIYQMIQKGEGIGVLPEFFCMDELHNGSMLRLLKDKSMQLSPLHIVYPASKNPPQKTKSFIEFANKIIQKKIQKNE